MIYIVLKKREQIAIIMCIFDNIMFRVSQGRNGREYPMAWHIILPINCNSNDRIKKCEHNPFLLPFTSDIWY